MATTIIVMFMRTSAVFFASKGVKKGFCGQLALCFQANEHAVKYKIV